MSKRTHPESTCIYIQRRVGQSQSENKGVAAQLVKGDFRPFSFHVLLTLCEGRGG